MHKKGSSLPLTLRKRIWSWR